MRGSVWLASYSPRDLFHYVPFDYRDGVPEGEQHLVGQGMLVTPLDPSGSPHFLVRADGDGFVVEGEGWILPATEVEGLVARVLARVEGPAEYRTPPATR